MVDGGRRGRLRVRVRETASRCTTTCPAASAAAAGAGTRPCASGFARATSIPAASPSRSGSRPSWSPSCSRSASSTPVTATFVEPLGCVLRSHDRARLRAGRLAARGRRGHPGPAADPGGPRPRRGGGVGARAAARAARPGRGGGRRAPRQRAGRRRDRVHPERRSDRRGRRCARARAGRCASTRRPSPERPLELDGESLYYRELGRDGVLLGRPAATSARRSTCSPPAASIPAPLVSHRAGPRRGRRARWR